MGLTSAENQNVSQNAIQCPAHSSINGLSAYTIGFCWETDDTTVSPDWRFIAKAFNAKMAQIQSDKKPQFFQGRGTTNATLKATPTYVTGAPQFYFYTFDETDGPRLYVGDEDSPPAEVAYDSRAVGAGSVISDSAFGFTILCTDQTGFARSLSGRWFWAFFEARRLVQGELEQRWREPIRVYPDSRLIWDSEVLDGGTGKVIDLSGHGNHGTIVGTTRNNRYPRMLRSFGASILWTPAAAAGGSIDGSASGTISIGGSAQGLLVPVGAGSGTISVDGVVSGVHGVQGTASGAIDIAGTSAAVHGVSGASSGAISIVGASTGVRGLTGTCSGSIPIAGVAAGTHGVTGTVSGSITIGGSAAGEFEDGSRFGAASGSIAIDGTAAGVHGCVGAASGAIELDGTAAGVHGVVGSCAGSILIAGAAVGEFEDGSRFGTAAGAISIGGLAAGVRGATGPASGLVLLLGAALGEYGIQIGEPHASDRGYPRSFTSRGRDRRFTTRGEGV